MELSLQNHGKKAVLYVYKKTKRVVILVTGMAVLGVGIAMIILPGPAILVIPLGLAILATEFFWAQHVLNKTKEKLRWK